MGETQTTEFDWPTDEGVWMGFVEKLGWFPFRTKALRDDLPTKQQLAAERRDPATAPPRAILAIVAQFPKSEKSWPYLFKGNHPATKWRRPDEEEKQKVHRFYGVPSQ